MASPFRTDPAPAVFRGAVISKKNSEDAKMKKSNDRKNTPAQPSHGGGPGKTNPDPHSYDPRKEPEKSANEERKGIDNEFGDPGRARESGSNAGGSQRGDDSDEGGSE